VHISVFLSGFWTVIGGVEMNGILVDILLKNLILVGDICWWKKGRYLLLVAGERGNSGDT
jgi:hypothetical protein